MKLAVLIKEVPDTSSDRHLNLETGLADRAATDAVLDEITERALEAALVYSAANEGSEVIALAMAPDSSLANVRKALAMGADRAVIVSDEALRGADITLSAEVLAAAIEREGIDLVLAGNQSTDGSSGMLPAAIAEILGVPYASELSALEMSADSVKGPRSVDGGVQYISAMLPAVATITEALPEPRFPNFKGIMGAKKKPIEHVSLAELKVNVYDNNAARTIMLSIAKRPQREGGIKIVDDGEAGVKLAEFLVTSRLV
ncbi:electron transfer flavoprotein subunit beta/FixA family protein [Paeniglutamicibacter cryotolerans]|uniref:Electron transfer flavoprotein subunit beta n=1 Tax=Paeniglutamicibacter cryotolerans TaxID=670079 RepID=A0A839QPJ2_9MICC|nr:electron transfer flavoprotein subunit beta/FixA family protein [Paeniglutamicibacter cryotolerans]MBB2997523.1 electron transfer flavoprotein beta subunit [Paeniglutamicibacter cryotolerans]